MEQERNVDKVVILEGVSVGLGHASNNTYVSCLEKLESVERSSGHRDRVVLSRVTKDALERVENHLAHILDRLLIPGCQQSAEFQKLGDTGVISEMS